MPLVGGVYLAVAVTTAARLRQRPYASTLLAALSSGAVFGITALVAAPIHSRLETERDPRLFSRLIRADRCRTLCAVTALAAAIGDVAAHGL